MLEISEILIYHIFEFYWPPKVTSTISKQPMEHDGNVENTKVYVNINANLYPLVHVIIKLDGY